jgi:hypothetical protein
MTSEKTTTGVVFAYSAPDGAKGIGPKFFQKNWKYNYEMSDAIKYELHLSLESVNIYVAPTFINMENPTFWVNQNQEKSIKREEIYIGEEEMDLPKINPIEESKEEKSVENNL